MAKFTFDQLMKMDIFARADAINSMSEVERKQVIIPSTDPTIANKNLRESMTKTPMGKYLAEA